MYLEFGRIKTNQPPNLLSILFGRIGPVGSNVIPERSQALFKGITILTYYSEDRLGSRQRESTCSRKEVSAVVDVIR